MKWNSVAPEEEKANVSQFFHILDSVAMVRGAVITDQGTFDITTYSCCANTRAISELRRMTTAGCVQWICMRQIWTGKN